MRKIILFLILALFITTPVQALDTGWYTISSYNNPTDRLSVPDTKSNIQISKAANKTGQKFLITSTGNGYKIGTGTTIGRKYLAGAEQKEITDEWQIIDEGKYYSLIYDDKYLDNNGEFSEDKTGKWILAPFKEKYTVVFKKDGEVVKRQSVEKGKSATAPDIDVEWDTDFSNVTSNLTVNAIEEIKGWYEIIPKNKEERVAVPYSSANNNIELSLESANNSNGQKFYINESNISTGATYLSPYYLSADNNTVKQTDNQDTWVLERQTDGSYEIKNNNKNIDVSNGVRLNADNNSNNQRFYLKKTSEPTGSLKYPVLFNRKWNYLTDKDLDDTEREIYNEIISNLNSDLTSVEAGRGKLSKLSATRIATAVQNTKYYAADFWLKDKKFIESYQYNRLTRAINYNPSKCKSTYLKTQQIENFAQNLANSLFQKGMEERETVSKLNKWFHDNITYHAGATFTGIYTGSYVTLDDCSGEYRQPYDLVIYKKGNCRAISMFGEIVLDITGIDSRYATFYNDNEGHVWNVIKVENTWFYYDFTWNLAFSYEKYGLTTNLWDDHKGSFAFSWACKGFDRRLEY